MQLTGTIQERIDAAISPLQIMQDNTPDYWNETTLPEIIQFVEEYIKQDPRDPARQERLGITDRSGEWGMGIDAEYLSRILKKNNLQTL